MFADYTEPATRCPNCGHPLRDLERVEAKHTPASVPKSATGYTMTRTYTIAECDRGHRYEASGGKGPLGWRVLLSSRAATNWPWPRGQAA